ncbi:MAG: FG-GAP repeat protein [Gammaproteobacteria bacterium]|nr:FG-GAP repeat protein [Gammaproteobacteria bacterium]
MVSGTVSTSPGGISSGSAHVFVRTPAGWIEEATLLPSLQQTAQNFGYSIDIEGDLIVVGAPTEDDTEQGQGAVYCFERQGSGWIQSQRILSGNPEGDGYFGIAVSLSGSLLAISSSGATSGLPANQSGNIDIHTLVAGTWSSEQIIATGGSDFSWGGNSHHLRGNLLVSTLETYSPQDLYGREVTIHERTTLGWSVVQTLTPPLTDQGLSRSFGDALSIRGDTLLIGAPNRKLGQHLRCGSVFAYSFDGSTWLETDVIEPPVRRRDQYFGWELDMDGDRAVFGSYAASPNDPRAFHSYRQVEGRWGLERVFAQPASVEGTSFGQAVAVSGDSLLASATSDDPHGAFSGSVQAYTIPRSYSSFCTPTATSLGEPARLFLTGPAQVDATGLELVVRPVPNQFGLVFLGDQTTNVPFGNGVRCVAGSLHRLAPLAAEQRELHIPFSPLAEGIMPGTTQHLQAWFRDPAAGGAGFDLSDAITISFLP